MYAQDAKLEHCRETAYELGVSTAGSAAKQSSAGSKKPEGFSVKNLKNGRQTNKTDAATLINSVNLAANFQDNTYLTIITAPRKNWKHSK